MRLLPLQSSRPGDFNCNTCNTKTPGSSPCQLMLVMVSSVASDIFEWNNNHTRIRTVSFIHVLKSIHLLVFFFFLCQSTQHLYISPKNRLKERCPKECVYKLPINTLTHALMHAHTRTPTVYIPPLFPLCRQSRQYLSDTLPPLSLVEARLAQVSVAKTDKIKQKCWMLSFVIVCFSLCLKVQTYRVQFGISPGTKTSQQVKVPSLFFFPPIHLAA